MRLFALLAEFMARTEGAARSERFAERSDRSIASEIRQLEAETQFIQRSNLWAFTHNILRNTLTPPAYVVIRIDADARRATLRAFGEYSNRGTWAKAARDAAEETTTLERVLREQSSPDSILMARAASIEDALNGFIQPGGITPRIISFVERAIERSKEPE